MTIKPEDAVIVITGASSGIGRATALAFAGRGARVVLASRQQQALEEVASQCRNLGGQALAVQTDVTNEYAVWELARRAVEQFGRIDVWINNAAVTLFGWFEEMPSRPFRRVIETNLFGYIHGARAALPRFREQGSGILINVSSVIGKTGQAYTSAYVTAKSGIIGLSKALRQDLVDAENIHVVTMLLASIDTPLFNRPGNFTGRAVRPMPPVYSAQSVAKAIIRAVENPRNEIFVGNSGRVMNLIHTLSPALFERMFPNQVYNKHFRDYPAPPSEGNLFEPDPTWNSISGGWMQNRRKLGGKAIPAGIAGAALLLVLLQWRAHKSQSQ